MTLGRNLAGKSRCCYAYDKAPQNRQRLSRRLRRENNCGVRRRLGNIALAFVGMGGL